jgi:hypothetical protein
VAAYCHVRDVGQEPLAAFALVFAIAAALTLLTGHMGLGSVLGVVAVLGGSLATVPPPWASRAGAPLADGLAPLGDLLVVTGFLAAVARHHGPMLMALTLLVCVLMAWLPLVKARTGPKRIAPTAGLWRRGDRLAILLLGGLVGRPAPALAALGVVLVLDAALRLERLENPAHDGSGSEGRLARRLVQEDGSLLPRLRWASLAVVAAAILLVPASDLWRF